MMVARSIKRFMSALSEGTIFTTRCLLHLGPRGAIDQMLRRLVAKGELLRIAQGVYVKGRLTREIPVEEIAHIKAESFGRRLITHASELVNRLSLGAESYEEAVDDLGRRRIVFGVDACASQFVYGDVVIVFKPIGSRRKELLAEQVLPGNLLRALWYLKEDVVSTGMVARAVSKLGRDARGSLQGMSACMPNWLNTHLGNLHRWSNRPERAVEHFACTFLPPPSDDPRDLTVPELLRAQPGYEELADIAEAERYWQAQMGPFPFPLHSGDDNEPRRRLPYH